MPQPLARLWLPGAEKGGVLSGFSGVVEHGQEAAKTVSSELTQAHSESKLGWKVSINGLLERGEAHQTLTVKVLDRTGLPVSGLKAEWLLARPGASEPQARQTLTTLSVGEYTGRLDLFANGRWLLELRLSQGNKIVYRETREVMRP